MNINPQVSEKLPEFLKHIQNLILQSGNNHTRVLAEEGSKYIKIIRQAGDTPGEGRCVHSFINKANGDILKAASWNAPAKHARGNILVDFSGVGAYGADYLK